MQQQQSQHLQMHIDMPEHKQCDIIVAISAATPEKTSFNRNITENMYESSNTEISMEDSEQNVFVRISEEATLPSSGESPSQYTSASHENDEHEIASSLLSSSSPPTFSSHHRCRRLSQPDQNLLDNLNIDIIRTRHTGRFLTMHKRRRKKLTTRSLNQEPALLDDIFHGQVQCVLQRAGHWRFNAFTLETVSGGRSLPVLCVHLFQWYGLLQHFNLDVVRVWKLFALIEEGYHSTNPYHNSIHATDVTQAMHCFLQVKKIKTHINNLEIMASLIAAVTHDLDHPGVNQPFLVATSNHLATLYENTSVLENHHWRSAIGCLLESGVYEQLSPDLRPELQRYISSLILATDITRQQEFLTRFKSYQDENILDMQCAEYRHFILQIALKCADISNPCRPWDISRKWSYKVCEEFFRQGDYERHLNLPVTPMCDRLSISIPKIQVGFIEFVVTPLYEEWHRFLVDGLSVTLMNYLRTNQRKWEKLITQENISETKIEISSDLDEITQDKISVSPQPDNSDDEIAHDDSSSLNLLLPESNREIISSSRRSSLPSQNDTHHIGRRHSIPMSIKNSFLLPVSSSKLTSKNRRESVPSDYNNKTSMNNKNSIFKFDNSNLDHLSSLSLLSTSSLLESITNNSSANNNNSDRPVSAENLLPETSIASITSNVEASRLCTVLQPDCNTRNQGKLTRQQTFPPLQPYARVRYMSTTAEMSKCCTEILMEADSPPSSSISTPTHDNKLSINNDVYNPPINNLPEQTRKINNNKFTTELKRESAFVDFNHLNVVDSPCGFMSERRRHSVQCMRLDDYSMKLNFKHKRPSSAQDDSAQTFYATLIGNSKIRQQQQQQKSSNILDNVKQIKLHVEESVENQQQQSTDCCMPLPDASGQSREFSHPELRRYSTPAVDLRAITSSSSASTFSLMGNESNRGNNGRRFTAIPTASELPITRAFFIGSPPESPPKLKSNSSSSDSSGVSGSGSESILIGNKRDLDCSRIGKNSKIPKLSKENVDPRGEDLISGSGKNLTTRRTSQGWARRRGSAPVGLMSKLESNDVEPISEITSMALATGTRGFERGIRRGSVPTDITEHYVFTAGGSFRSALGPRGENIPIPRRASLPHNVALSNILTTDENCPAINNNNNNGNNNNSGKKIIENIPGMLLSPRRGSVPADISELRRDLFGRNSVNAGKLLPPTSSAASTTTAQRNRTKKTLRRRRSGGPEMFVGRPVDDNDNNGKWMGWKRDLSKRDSIPEPSVKRRGSLPVEMLSISHAGRYNYR
ncbi:hypothetical protein PV327_009652 [Microctonus hyperodae]|uniref:Phosphodiesterase n=1 Tax=Microctonus hyperodae TaxID=165561 RepID=A0AA39F0I2_MICHY|nr:hypothetical protein PV327_009652 [Microctonus hyperodae]